MAARFIVDIFARQYADRRFAHVAEADDNRLGRQPRRIERAAPDEARQFRRYDDRALMCHRTAALSRSAWGEAPLEFRRSEEHTSELQSLMRNSYSVFCL